jgi:hypothetical protein
MAIDIGKQFRNFGKSVGRGFNKFGRDARRDFNRAGKVIKDKFEAVPKTLEKVFTKVIPEAINVLNVIAPAIAVVAPQVGVPLLMALKVIKLAKSGYKDAEKSVSLAKKIIKQAKKGDVAGALASGKELQKTGGQLVDKAEKGGALVGELSDLASEYSN